MSVAADETQAEATSVPKDAESVAAALREASASGMCVIPFGGGTKQHIGYAPPTSHLLLQTQELSNVHHYDPGDLTVGVGAGTTLAALQRVLAEKKQFLPIDPMLPEQATVGGTLAANAFGPLKAGYGGARDFCIGIEFATTDGLVAKAGGRVVKNVAGYDLMKLLIGSYGTLGVITAANFKVYPKPEHTTTFVARFSNIEDLIGYRDRQRASLRNAFMAMEVISPRAHEYLIDEDVRDPDDYAPSGPVKPVDYWSLAVLVSGSAKVVARYRHELRTEHIEEVDDEALWTPVRNLEVAIARRHRNAMVLYASAPPGEVTQVLKEAEAVASQFTMLNASIGRVTTGNLVLCFMPLAVDPASAMAFANLVSALRGRVSRNVSILAARCPSESKVHFNVWGGSLTDLSTMRAVKDAMDPKHILNRGRFIVG